MKKNYLKTKDGIIGLVCKDTAMIKKSFGVLHLMSCYVMLSIFSNLNYLFITSIYQKFKVLEFNKLDLTLLKHN